MFHLNIGGCLLRDATREISYKEEALTLEAKH